MAFLYAEPTGGGLVDSGTIVTLNPFPSQVDYPPTDFDFNVRASRDGNSIIQRGKEDHRVRSWIWEGYRKRLTNMPVSSYYQRYDDLYNGLLNLQYKTRLNATPPASEYVFLRDEETGQLDHLTLNGSTWEKNPMWVRVKVLQVTRAIAPEGGNVIYPTTTMTFIIDDPIWTAF